MVRRLVYVAGPFGPRGPNGDESEIAENVRRAVALARFAQASGYAPIVIHPAIFEGAYGRDSVREERSAGLASACAIAEAVARQRGLLWGICRMDWSRSAGTQREIDAFLRGAGPENVEVHTWAIWHSRMTFQAA